MTLPELILQLQALELEGHGDLPVVIFDHWVEEYVLYSSEYFAGYIGKAKCKFKDSNRKQQTGDVITIG